MQHGMNNFGGEKEEEKERIEEMRGSKLT